MIRVLIVDQHPLAREGLRGLLEYREDIEIVGEAQNGAEAIERLLALQPQVVLMDIRLPDAPGLDVARRVKAELPATAVVVLTNYNDIAVMIDTIVAGASAFLLKEISSELLFHTIHAVLAGGILLDETLFREAIKLLRFTAPP
jgi:DNA-binding NarL/FixJ family response regulator